MRLLKKNISRVSLVDLLRRKRTTLAKFIKDNGIVTYDLLVNRCNSMGVVAPDEAEFNAVTGNGSLYNVSSPTEGVIVLEPPSIIADNTGKIIPDVTVSYSSEFDSVSSDEQGVSASNDEVSEDSQETTTDYKKKKKKSS